MAGTVKFEIKGGWEMERLLRELAPGVSRRLGAAALRAGAKPIVEAAKSGVRVDTGALRDSITIVTARTSDQENQRTVQIGFKKPASAYAHLIEYGSAHSAAHPFIRPAMDAQAETALQVMATNLRRGIDRELKKMAKP